ncbi:MAG: hypothetical protein LBK47_04190 [Prevotellaceae bacterium]|nr:hypothetical protein [Prevotellaceae bacterium]
MLILSCGLAFASCQRYAMRGHATEDFLNTVIEYTEPNDIILVVGKPPHEGEGLTLGISTYLKTHNRSNLYVYPLTEKKDAGGLLNFYNSKDIDAIADKDKIQAIAIFSGMEKLFTEKSQAWLTGGYTVYSFNGGYAVYAKALK